MAMMLQGVPNSKHWAGLLVRGGPLRVERLEILILAAPAGYMWMQPMQAPWPCCLRCASTSWALKRYR